MTLPRPPTAAINLVTPADVGSMRDVEAYYHTQIEEMPMDIADLI